MPPKPPPPVPAKTAPPVGSDLSFAISSGKTDGPQRIGIYGPGGCGKTSLAASLKQIGKKPLFLDVDDGSREMEVDRIVLDSWSDLRTALSSIEAWKNYDVVVIDSLTRAEELAVIWTLDNVPNDKKQPVTSIEGYGYGKGYTHIYETFMPILGQLDQHKRAGRDVVLICHDCTANVPNPSGDDFIRYEPRLQSPSSGKSSIRHRVKEWLDHLLFIGYDVSVNNEGKAAGRGTRTIYPQEMPTHWAKSRRLSDTVPYELGGFEIWKQLFGV